MNFKNSFASSLNISLFLGILVNLWCLPFQECFCLLCGRFFFSLFALISFVSQLKRCEEATTSRHTPYVGDVVNGSVNNNRGLVCFLFSLFPFQDLGIIFSWNCLFILIEKGSLSLYHDRSSLLR